MPAQVFDGIAACTRPSRTSALVIAIFAAYVWGWVTVRLAARPFPVESRRCPSLRVQIQNPLHEEIAADEHVTRSAGRGSPKVLVIGTSWNDRHVATGSSAYPKSLCSHSW